MVDEFAIVNDPATLSPLPIGLLNGLSAVVVLGLLSLVTTTTLFLHLGHRILRSESRQRHKHGHTHQLVLLLFNLILADIQQSLAFVLNITWLATGSIKADSHTCWAQGWFLSVGDLASGVFTFAIALHSFSDIVFAYRLPRSAFLVCILSLWSLVYAAPIAGIARHPHDFYARAGPWCWVNVAYPQQRLWLHYFWLITCEFSTLLLYTALFCILRARPSTTASRAARLIVAYPVVYLVCTLPLVCIRLRMLAGHGATFAELCFAGALITSNGWLDVLLYSFTRRALIFGPEAMMDERVGALETFGKDSNWRPDCAYGTTTTIEAGWSNKSGGTVDEISRGSMEKLFRKTGGRRTSVMAETVVQVQSEIMPVVVELEAVHLRDVDLEAQSTPRHARRKVSETRMSLSKSSTSNFDMGPNVHELAPWIDVDDRKP